MNATEHPRRILIAEDDPAILHLLSLQLEIEGYQVVPAANGAIAWELLQQDEPPELVILDVMMPKVDGFEVCRRIRSDPRLEALPVVILTALQDSGSRLQGLEAGANDFLAKPWSKAELYARIRTLLRLKEVQDQLRRQHRRIGLLYDIGRELSALMDLDQILSLMLARSAHVVEASGGSVVLMRNGRADRKIQMNPARETEVIAPPSLSTIEQAVSAWLLKFGRPLLIADTEGKVDFAGWSSVRSLVATPFIHQQQQRGFLLLLHHQPDWFDNDHLELLDSIARQATITIENVWLFERVQEERQRFAALIASMNDAVIATGREQEIILANPAAALLLDRDESTLTDRPLKEVIQEPTLTTLFDKVAAEKRPASAEIDWSRDQTLYTTVSSVGGGGEVAVIQDISPLKALQAMQLAAEQEKTARVRATFERYLSPQLVDRVLSEERGLLDRRERREVAILFADLRGFTRLTARFSPDDVVEILNEFFTVMTNIVYSYHGTVFDIAGDEILIGFGAPFALPDPIDSAVRAAIEMQTVFDGLADKWWQTFGDKRVGMGIGIEYGEVVVGNVGSPTRMNYALVGLPVNMAHALVNTAADGEIRISRAVMKRFRTRDLSHPITPVPGVQLKGHDQPETVYRIAITRPLRPPEDMS